VKRILAIPAVSLAHPTAAGVTLLTYHRVGGASGDELDVPLPTFSAHLDVLQSGHDVVSLDEALDGLDAGEDRPRVVLTFDDGFADVHERAFPILAERGLPFTLYLVAGLVGASMRWEGSAAKSQGSSALTWDEIAEMAESGLCTIGNHTFSHAGPDTVDAGELDRCSDAIEERLGRRPAHFAWTWGVAAPRLLPLVRERFRSAATGIVGRNHPGGDRHSLCRVPVRSSDPLPFFQAKLTGDLWAERSYERIVDAAKAARKLARRG
jgi:peptidoglycan/xylan/chitin deacetylase (PgdA/CDA1 family)